MKKIILSSVLAGAVLVGGASDVQAAKAKKKESEVMKTLKQAYPDAEINITNTNEVNGIKVYDVSVKTKQGGESTAQITDYADFLMYGVPHEYGAIRSAIQQDVSGLFQSKPEDIEMYRVTNYFVDFKGQKGKTYTATFDAVGRLMDIESHAEAAAASEGAGSKKKSDAPARGERIKDDETVRKVANYVKREMPEAELEAVYPSAEQGEDFMIATLKGGGEVVLNKQGQVYSLRQPITEADLPDPVAASIKQTFTAPIAGVQRGEYEYYQFNQQSQKGTPIVVKMRPNGDILEVRNVAAEQEEQAVQAKTKAKKSTPAAKKG